MNIEFIEIDLTNIDEYERLSNPNKKFNDFDGPYFKKNTMEEHSLYINSLRDKLKNNDKVLDNMRLFIYDGKILGLCSWYWKSKETKWLEIGIVIFEEYNWSKGIGTKALSKWIYYVFDVKPEIVRIGFTSWSGNLGMINVGKKLNFKQEACYKKARIVNGEYYDSVSYGILKEEWNSK